MEFLFLVNLLHITYMILKNTFGTTHITTN